MRKPTAISLLALFCGCFSPPGLDLEPETDATTGSVPTGTDGTSEDGPTSSATSMGATSGGGAASSDESGSTSTGGEITQECGDSIITAPEACDDGVNDGSYGGCLPGCLAPAAFCGDATVNGPEGCDDGDDINGNGCNIDCGPSAEIIWTDTHTGPTPCADERASGVAALPDGSFAVVGVECTNDGRRARVSRYDAEGTEAWNELFDDGGAAIVTAEGVTATGEGIVVVGRSDTTGYFRTYNLNGAPQWTSFREPQAGGFVSVLDAAAAPGGLVQSAGGEALGGDFVGFANRIDETTGVESWEYQTPASGSAFLGLAVDPDTSDLLAVGFTNSGAAEGDNILIERISPSGSVVWDDEYNGAENERDQARAVAFAPDGTLVVVGQVREGTRDMWIRRYSAEGSVLWTETVDSPESGTDEASGVVIDSQGAVIVAGRLDRSDLSQGSDAWLRKYAADGGELWTRTHNSDADSYDAANAVTVDAEDRIVVVGKEGINAAQDGRFWVRMYAP